MADGRLSTEDLVVRPGDTGEPPAAGGAGARDLPLLEDGEADAFLRRLERGAGAASSTTRRARSATATASSPSCCRRSRARFAAHKDGLEQSWRGGGEADTEQLRLALQSYRSFFQRLLST